MGSFQWKFVEYKEQNGFVIVNFPLGAGYNTGGAGLSRKAKKCAIPLGSGRGAGQERGIQTKQGDWESQAGC